MADYQTANTSGRSDRNAGQQQSATSGLAESASELWDSAYEQGEQYYRRGAQAVGTLDATTVTGLLVAGAIGFGLAWLIFGQYGTDDVARRMSESSARFEPNYGRRRHQ